MKTTETRKQEFISWLKKQEILAEEIAKEELSVPLGCEVDGVVANGSLNDLMQENPVAIIMFVKKNPQYINRIKPYLHVLGLDSRDVCKKSYKVLWEEHERKRKHKLALQQAWMEWLYEDIA